MVEAILLVLNLLILAALVGTFAGLVRHENAAGHRRNRRPPGWPPNP